MAQHGGETCVCRSTLQAETLSLLLGSEEADHLRFVLYSIKGPNHHRANWTTDAMDEIDVDWFTDCRSLFQHVNQSGLHVVTGKEEERRSLRRSFDHGSCACWSYNSSPLDDDR